MNTRAITAGAGVTPAQGREAQWYEFYRALAERNFVRAGDLAGQLNVDAKRVRRIRRDAVRQFMAEYQNYEGAARLIAEYGLTAEEVRELADELAVRPELASKQTFSLQSGSPAHLSVAEQIRRFAGKQIEST
ncbi:MAG TPA: hypothetical protein VFD58_02565 [Blastocatellia bacterium]|nr:hypothetical protein [Blastocatellia bacterium]